MEIIISNQSPDPIYLQIYNRIRAMIISGQLGEGQVLPSMRLLARDLRVSMITTKRAYEELEKRGYIYTVAGKGCFVAAADPRLYRDSRLKELDDLLSRAAGTAKLHGISPEEAVERLKAAFEKE